MHLTRFTQSPTLYSLFFCAAAVPPLAAWPLPASILWPGRPIPWREPPPLSPVVPSPAATSPAPASSLLCRKNFCAGHRCTSPIALAGSPVLPSTGCGMPPVLFAPFPYPVSGFGAKQKNPTRHLPYISRRGTLRTGSNIPLYRAPNCTVRWNSWHSLLHLRIQGSGRLPALGTAHNSIHRGKVAGLFAQTLSSVSLPLFPGSISLFLLLHPFPPTSGEKEPLQDCSGSWYVWSSDYSARKQETKWPGLISFS